MSSFNENLRDSAVFNLTSAVTMVVDDSSFSLDLTAAALRGFGVNPRYICQSAAEAMEILKDQAIDLLLVDSQMPGMDGHELVRWLRSSNLDPNSFVPVIMTAGHVRKSSVGQVRDCGANFLVTKPFSAASLLARLIWVAKDTRPFLQAGDYRGPDRRFNEAVPRQEGERRADMAARLVAQAKAVAKTGQLDIDETEAAPKMEHAQ